MVETRTIRVTRVTRDALNALAADRHESLAQTVARGLRSLRQEAIARDLSAPLRADEREWLDADAG